MKKRICVNLPLWVIKLSNQQREYLDCSYDTLLSASSLNIPVAVEVAMYSTKDKKAKTLVVAEQTAQRIKWLSEKMCTTVSFAVYMIILNQHNRCAQKCKAERESQSYLISLRDDVCRYPLTEDDALALRATIQKRLNYYANKPIYTGTLP